MFQSHIYIPGFSIGLGMASHGQVPMTYSGAGHVAQPKTKLSSPSKNEFQIIPLRQMKKSTKSSSWIEQFIWKNMKYFSKPYIHIYSRLFHWSRDGESWSGVPMTYSGAGHVAQPKTKLSSSKNELPNHPIETNEEMHQKLKLDRTIHLEKYEIFFNAYVPGLYIGLGMAIRWSMTIPEPAMYSPAQNKTQQPI